MTNVLTIALLDISNVVIASSESSYGFAWARELFEPAYLPIDESHPQMPQEVYGLSKILNEKTGAMFQRRTGMQVTVLWFAWVMNDTDFAYVMKDLSDPKKYKNVLWSYIDLRDEAAACTAAVEYAGGGYYELNIRRTRHCLIRTRLR